MRKGLLLLLLCLANALFAMSDFTLQKVRGGYQFYLTLPDYSLETVTVSAKDKNGAPVGGSFTKLTIPGYTANVELGAPQLLSSTFELALATPGGSVSYTVTEVDTVKLTAPLYPKQHNLASCSDGTLEYFSYDRDLYAAASAVPVVSVDAEYTFRAQDALSIRVSPVSYNAAANELYVVKKVAVSIDAATPTAVRAAGSKHFDKIMRARFKNLQGALGNDVASEGNRNREKYLVIVASNYKNSASLTRLIEHRQAQYDVEVVDNGSFGSSKDDYRDFIRGKMPTYVVLVGDDSDFPEHSFQFNMGQYITVKSFSYYICARTSGTPSPEIAMGVFLVNSENELKNMVDKTIAAEANNEEMPDVFVGVGGNTRPMGQLKADHCDLVVKEMAEVFFSPKGYEYVSSYSYISPKGDKSDIINATNSGARFINYNGHGMQTEWVHGWGNNDLGSLTNTEYFPYVLSCCCYTGTFDMQCMARAYATSANGPSAFIASYEQSSMGQHPLNYGMYEAIMNDGVTKYGLAFVYAANSTTIPKSCQVMPGDETTTRLMQWQYHLYGDPALETIDKFIPDNDPTVTVTAPNGGEKLSEGDNFEIKWNDNVDDKATITLLKDGSEVKEIATAVDGNSYTWKVEDVELADGYKIVVTCGDLADTSDASFLIKESAWSDNLVAVTTWGSGCDEYTGENQSTVNMSHATREASVSASFSIGKMDADAEIYPWANVSAYFASDLDGITAVKVLYKADTKINLTLDQEVLMDKGTSYGYELPASSSFSEVVVNLDQFAQPDWVSDKTDLDLKKVKAISFSPIGYDMDASLEIKDARLADFSGEFVSILNSNLLAKQSSPVSLLGVKEGALNLSIAQAGDYKVSVVTVHGRVLVNSSLKMSAGLNSVHLTEAFSSQVLLLTVEGMGNQFKQKLIVK